MARIRWLWTVSTYRKRLTVKKMPRTQDPRCYTRPWLTDANWTLFSVNPLTGLLTLWPSGQMASASPRPVRTIRQRWEAQSGKELLTLRGHSGSVFAVAFSPDGKRLATASADRSLQIYALDLRDLINLARSRVTRPLTSEECQRYFEFKDCPPLP